MTLITKEDLIEALQDLPEGAMIRLASPSHDHWRSVIASPVASIIEEEYCAYSDYHQSDVLVNKYAMHNKDGVLLSCDGLPVTQVYLLRGTK